MLWRLNKPEYFFRPKQIFFRLLRARKSSVARKKTVVLPWGLQLEVNISETIGFAIWHLGLYDLLVSEMLWRLAEPGEEVADVGANIGHMSSLFAARVGKNGKVTSFEPHPEIFKILSHNSESWAGSGVAKVEVIQKAASETAGQSQLMIPENFSSNTGTAFIEGAQNSSVKTRSFPIEVVTLDDFYGDRAPKVMKIDTEGSELMVLRGGNRLLDSKAIRDIIFESHEAYPNPVMSFLEQKGYTLFKLKKKFFGPELLPISTQPSASDTHVWEAASYLATTAPQRALEKTSKRSWLVLNSSLQ